MIPTSLLGWVNLCVLHRKCFYGTEWIIIGIEDPNDWVLGQNIDWRRHSIQAKFKVTWLGSKNVSYVFGYFPEKKYFKISQWPVPSTAMIVFA